MRVSDYLFSHLINESVTNVFLVTGRGALFLSDAIAANNQVEGISLHHEQSAAFAAVAYAHYSGNLGACMVSTGCAGTNALTGVLNAWQDGIPCIFISGQNKLKETSRFTGIPIRTFGQQEADIIPIVESITKYSIMLDDPQRIAYELDKAIYFAKTGRKGPVWIDIPLDIQNMRIDPDELERFKPKISESFVPTKDDLNYLIKNLNSAERPIALIGSGIHSAGAVDELELFLKTTNLPLVYSASASDIYGTSNQLSIGSVGIMGCSRAANFTIQNSDFVLVLGSRLSPMTTGSEYCKFARDAKIAVVDIDKVEHSKNTINIDRLIISDLKLLLKALLKESGLSQVKFKWQNKCIHWKNIFPVCENQFVSDQKVDLYFLAECLSKTLPDNVVFITDSGLIELILPTNIRFKNGQRCIHPASQGSMGYALPAVVGAYYASKKPVIAVVGDGSIMMNLQELETISYKNIPAKIFVINNNAYAVIRKRQKELFRRRTIGTDPGDGVGIPDFAKVANAFDINYLKIEDSIGLESKLKEVLDQGGPVLCEIIGREDQDYISVSHARNKKGRFVQRPLEDQAPFLDRELFLSEMLIEPIDQ